MPEKTLTALRLVAGLVLVSVAFMAFSLMTKSGPTGAVFVMVFIVLPATVAAGILLAPHVSRPVADFFSGLLFPTGDRFPLRRQFSSIKAKMAQGQYQEAEKDLQEIVARHPDYTDAKMILVELYDEHLGQPERALEIVRGELGSPGWEPEYEQMVMVAVDICLDQGRADEAGAILKSAIRKAGKRPVTKHFEIRLSALGE